MGVSAGVNLHMREKSLERPYEFNADSELNQFNTYERLPEVHGLTPYRATKNLSTNIVLDDERREHSSLNHVLYFARDEDHKIVAFIKCGSGLTSVPGGTHTCQHRFVLWPEMKAEAELAYADGLLPNWREYQARYRELLLGFRLKPSVQSSFAAKP